MTNLLNNNIHDPNRIPILNQHVAFVTHGGMPTDSNELAVLRSALISAYQLIVLSNMAKLLIHVHPQKTPQSSVLMITATTGRNLTNATTTTGASALLAN